MIPLAAALAAPVLGAMFYGALHPRPAATRLVDGLVYLAVPILVALQVLPQSWDARELLSLVAVAGGAGLYFVLERVSRALAAHADNVAILVALSGLVLHAFLEGAALVPGRDSDAFFVYAVVLHRLPIGLVIWWLIGRGTEGRPRPSASGSLSSRPWPGRLAEESFRSQKTAAWTCTRHSSPVRYCTSSSTRGAAITGITITASSS